MDFHNLPSESFPITVELLRSRDRSVAWSVVVEGPRVLTLPPVGKRLREPIGVRVTYGNGEQHEAWPS